MTTALADMSTTWRCKCGKSPYRHYEHCVCGEARPEPPPPEPPSDKVLPEVDAAFRGGIASRALRDLVRLIAELPTTPPTKPGRAWNNGGVLTFT